MSNPATYKHKTALANAATLLLTDAAGPVTSPEYRSSVVEYLTAMFDQGASRADFMRIANAFSFLATSMLRAEHLDATGTPETQRRTPALDHLRELQQLAVSDAS